MGREVNKDQIYRDIAKKLELPLDDVEAAVKHQFKSVASTMKEGNFQAIRLPYFGKFWVKPQRLKRLKEKGK